MKKMYFLLIAVILFSCNTETDSLNQLIRNGEFFKAIEIINLKLQNTDNISTDELNALQKKLYDMKAVQNEYSLTYVDVFKELKIKIPDLSETDMQKWENDYSLEYYLIDGEKKYYYNCIFDLMQVNEEAAIRAKIPKDEEYDASKYPLETITSIENDSVFSKKINIAFSFFQDIKSLPDQSVLKAWIPYVRENKFQSNIKILYSSINNIILPGNDNLTSMIYFEHTIDKKHSSSAEWAKYFTKPLYSWIKPMKKPTFVDDSTFVFQFIYEYESKAYYKTVNIENIKPFKKLDIDYQKYTKETVSNQFTPYLKNLSKEIVGKETNDYLKAKSIYEWICRNIIWTEPKSVLGDYAEYTAKYKRGDCASKSNLFISLCRINKIPARIQGGWLVQPEGHHAQHSWAQVYFEPYGWMPVDVTIGTHLINHKDDKVRYFYFGNCTPYHLIIYDDETEFVPTKDFECIYGGGSQLGAIEWIGGDIEPYIKTDSYVE